MRQRKVMRNTSRRALRQPDSTRMRAVLQEGERLRRELEIRR